jgi:DNA-binding NarL/FixJ family response regulator
MGGAPSDSYVGGLFRTASAGNMSRSYKSRRRYQAEVAQAKKRAKKQGTSRLDEFAEHLANGLTPKEAAEPLGLSPSSGRVYLATLRKRLGPQAV